MAATGLLGINPYQKGEVLDISSKPVNLSIQNMQHEYAKNEALDKYFMDMDKNVNLAGVRSIDQDAVLQKLAENRDLFFKNKDAIRHPEKYGTDLYNKFMNNYRDALGIVNESKETVGTLKALQTLQAQAKARGEVVDDNVLHGIADMEYGVRDTRHKKFDVANFSSYIPSDVNKYRSELKNVTLNPGKEETDYSTVVLPGNKEERYFIKHYPDLNELQSYSNSKINSQNPKIAMGERKFAQAVLDSPSEVARLGQIYKERTNQEMPKTLEGVHLAHTLELAPIVNKPVGGGETEAYGTMMFNRAEKGRNARNANLAGAAITGSTVDQILDRTRTGKKFTDNPNVEILNIDPKVANPFIKEIRVPKTPLDYKIKEKNKKEGKSLPFDEKSVKLEPAFGENTDKEKIVVYPILDDNGQPTGKYDWSNQQIQSDAIRAGYVNVQTPSGFKAKVAATTPKPSGKKRIPGFNQ